MLGIKAEYIYILQEEDKRKVMKYSQYKTLRNVLLEFFGTAVIVYFTNWANVLYALKQVSLSSLALIYGLMTSVLVYIAQSRSGAHFDPAVTVDAVNVS